MDIGSGMSKKAFYFNTLIHFLSVDFDFRVRFSHSCRESRQRMASFSIEKMRASALPAVQGCVKFCECWNVSDMGDLRAPSVAFMSGAGSLESVLCEQFVDLRAFPLDLGVSLQEILCCGFRDFEESWQANPVHDLSPGWMF